MKYVVVPETIAIMNKDKPQLVIKEQGAEPEPFIITHEDFVFDNIVASADLSKSGGEGARRHRKIVKAFEGCKAGDVIGVEDADFKVARTIIDNLNFNSAMARYVSQLLPHIEAWEAADKQDDAWKKKRDSEPNGKATIPPTVEEAGSEVATN